MKKKFYNKYAKNFKNYTSLFFNPNNKYIEVINLISVYGIALLYLASACK